MHIEPEALAALCQEVFGINLDRQRVSVLAPRLKELLLEIRTVRELDLSAVTPAVIFDPLCVYRDGGDED